MFSTTSSKASIRMSLLVALLVVVFQSIAATRLPRDEKYILEHGESPIPLTNMLPTVPHDDVIELATPQSLTPPLKAYQANRHAATLIVDKVFMQKVNNAKSLFDGRLQGAKNAVDAAFRFGDKYDPFYADHNINADRREPPKQSELPLLNDITFSARSGEITAIMGPSGFGKTTLLNVIGHRLKQQSGNVTVNGSPHYSAYYMTQGAKDLDREQTIFTAVDNARRNAEINDPNAPRKTTDALLRSVGLREHQYRRIGTHAKDLISGGQLIRVAIAQALATNRRVLLLDEPLTGLSSQDIQLVMRSIKRVAKEDNLIVLMTLHDPSQEVVDEIDKFFFFSAAGPIFSGSQAEMIDHLKAFKHHLTVAQPPVNPAFIAQLFKPNAICTTVMSHIASPDYISSFDAPLYTKETARAQNVYDMEEDNGLDVSIGPYLAQSAQPMYRPEDISEVNDSFDGLEQAHEDGQMVFSIDKLGLLYKRFNEAYSTSAEGYKEARRVNRNLSSFLDRKSLVAYQDVVSVMAIAMICFPLMKHNLDHRIAFASLIYYMMITSTITQILTVQPFLNYRRAAMEEVKNGQYSKLEFSLAMDAVVIQKEILFSALFMIPVFLFSGLPRDIGTIAISFAALFGMKLCTYAANKIILQHADGPTVLLAGATTLLQLFQTFSGFLNPAMSPVINWFLHINYFAHGLRAMMNRNLERMVFTGGHPSESVPGSAVLDLYGSQEKVSVSMAYLFGSLFVMYFASLLISSGSIKEWPLLRRPQPKGEKGVAHSMPSELPSPALDWKDPLVEERLTEIRPSYFRRHRMGRLFSSPDETAQLERGRITY